MSLILAILADHYYYNFKFDIYTFRKINSCPKRYKQMLVPVDFVYFNMKQVYCKKFIFVNLLKYNV